MNVWMKRGLQTALITGGLLTAGTGLASADDSATVTVPVTVTDNALAVLGTAPGTTPAEIDLPALKGTVGADLGGMAIVVPIDVAQPSAAPSSGGSNSSGGSGDATAAGSSTGAAPVAQASLLDGNVPVLVCGNAVGVLGDAGATCTAPAPAAGGSTDGTLVDVDAPVTVCGVAVGVLGDAAADCTAPAPAAGGPTDGTLLDVDAPITVCGIGAGIAGRAGTTCTGPAAPVTPATPVQPTSGQPGGHLGAVSAVPASASGAVAVGDNGSADRTVTGANAGTESALAHTGSPLLWKLLGGLLVMVLGLGLTVLGRRRAGVLG
jgi:hypothetical protein